MLKDPKHDTHLFEEVNQATMHGPLDKIKVQFVCLSTLQKLDASEQQKCLMLCNDSNVQTESKLCLKDHVLVA